ncbi:hypothetical protein M408DRAFT_317358 [Serendipita vermifera MAFF 305830]|uniref:Granulins domain-containing protein n=1 Tax=Serendipita vermifera MAFF 305830 TaxID=933852 RepID=A0A0C3AJ19_SERVB|nr:hypothetical protein M408DRAFT_317358 [Serendipita vermifera MAFF 305830]
MLTKTLFSLFILGTANAAHAAGALYARQDTPLLRADPRIDIPATLQDPQKRKDGLYARQGVCTVGHACSTGGCCEGDCCGNGCCPTDYTCQYVVNTAGCCPVGETCGGGISGCTDSSLVECANYDHCCPRGETCSLLNGNAHCSGQDSGSSGDDSGSSGNDNSNSGNSGNDNGSSGNDNGSDNGSTDTWTSTEYEETTAYTSTTTSRTSATSTTSRTTTSTSKTSSTIRASATLDSSTVSPAALNGGYPRMVTSNVGVVCLAGLVTTLLA